MTRKNRLPYEILENIRQFAGNFRIYKGELIQTLDKKGTIFQKIETKIKERQKMTYFMVFGNGWSNTLTGYNGRCRPFDERYFKNKKVSPNWKISITWLDKLSDYVAEQHSDVVDQLISDKNEFPPRRVFSYNYYGETDVLTFSYLRVSFVPGFMDGWESFEKPVTRSENVVYTIE